MVAEQGSFGRCAHLQFLCAMAGLLGSLSSCRGLSNSSKLVRRVRGPVLM